MKLPKGWKTARFGEIATFRNGLNFVLSDSGDMVSVVGVKDFQRHFSIGYENLEKVKIAGRLSENDLLQNDDLLFVRSNGNKALVGRCLLIKNVLKHISFSGFTIRARLTSAAACSTFLGYYFHSGYARRRIDQAGGGTNISNLSQDILASIDIPLPPLPEQYKIAEILGAWDDGLEKLDALIAAKERRKKGLMQRLLTGKRRVKGQPWRTVRLLAVAEEKTIRNGGAFDRSRLYAVTKAEGMVPMRERVQGQSVERCKIVERGWFAYNPMRLNIGSIARWQDEKPVMVSGDYVVFAANESKLLSDYLNHVRQSAAWCNFTGASGSGSVRVRIWFDDLGRFSFPLPSLPEQRAIADILDACDEELRLLRDQRAAVEMQKRGLMQRLLTGKVKLKTEECEHD